MYRMEQGIARRGPGSGTVSSRIEGACRGVGGEAGAGGAHLGGRIDVGPSISPPGDDRGKISAVAELVPTSRTLVMKAPGSAQPNGNPAGTADGTEGTGVPGLEEVSDTPPHAAP